MIFENRGRSMVAAAVTRFTNALPDGVPGLPSAEEIKPVFEFDFRVPMKFADPVPPENVMDFRWV